MIVSAESRVARRLEIDLNGPEGNAFVLMGIAQRLAKNSGYTQEERDALRTDMTSGDYEHLLSVMEQHFGSIIIMYR